MFHDLSENQVFVFGSNAQGFHGAGSAGFAMRGDHRNAWRQDKHFLEAMKSPEGSESRMGKYAVYGVGRGFQTGREGSSYAIQTVTRPGARKSVSRREIYYQLVQLWDFVKSHTELEFVIAPLAEGYAGYSHEEMQEVWDFLHLKHGKPGNVTHLSF